MAADSPDTSVEHKAGGSVDAGSSVVPCKTPALLAARKESLRIAQAHPLTRTQELPSAGEMSGEGPSEASWENVPSTIKTT